MDLNVKNLFDVNTEITKSLFTLESVMRRHLVTVMNSTDEYVSGHPNRRRLVIVMIAKVLVLIAALVMGLSAIINEVISFSSIHLNYK